MSRNYIAFISYRHAKRDSAVAKAIHGLIEQYRIPRSLRKNGNKRLGIVFRDQEELPVSSDLTADIEEALDHAEYLIVVCTPNTPQSIWVEREIRHFLKNHPRDHVLTILAEGEPSEAFLPLLTQVVDENTGEIHEVEPLAADIRADSISASLRLLKKQSRRLFAAMLGCPYDALVLREQRRQFKRALSSAAAVFAVVAIFIGMLLVKNTQLTAQKEAVQLSESELLTSKAEEAIANEDYYTAIEAALDALPKENDPRPYYAPAEKALFEALDFTADAGISTVMRDTTFEQSTPIDDLIFNEDGSRLVTSDMYGVLQAFDTTTAAPLWTYSLCADDLDGAVYRTTKMEYVPSLNAVIGWYGNEMSAVSLENGSVLWSYEASPADDVQPVLSPDGKLLCFVQQSFEFPSLASTYEFTVLNTADGTEATRIPLIEDSFGLANFSAGLCDYNPSYGVFSEDGSLFAGVYYGNDGTEANCAFVYMIDIANGRLISSQVLSLPTEYYTNCPIVALNIADDHTVSLFQASSISDYQGWARQLDMTDGTLIYDVAIPTDDDTQWYTLSSTTAYYNEGVLYAAVNDTLYAIPESSGEVYASGTFLSNIAYLAPLEDARFTLMLQQNGTYTILWVNSDGISYRNVTTLGEASDYAVYKNGCFAPVIEGNAVKGIDCQYDADAGFVAVVPVDASNTVAVKRPVALDTIFPRTLMDSSETDATYLNTAQYDVNDSMIVLGPIGTKADDGSLIDEYRWINTDTHETVATVTDVEYLLSDESLLALKDGSGLVHCDTNGSCTVVKTDGTTVILRDEDTVTLQTIEGEAGEQSMEYVANRYINSAAKLTESGEILLASADSEALSLWLDGAPLATVAFPETVHFSLTGNLSFARMLAVGENGYVVTSHFEGDDADTMSAFAVYNVDKGSWNLVADAVNGSTDRTIVLGKVSATMAVLDIDNTIRLYDLDRGECINSISLGVPASSVVQATFLQEDRLLALVTSDGQLRFYNVTEGTLVHTYQTEKTLYGTGQWREDTDTERIYYIDPSKVGLCFEQTSWTLLFSDEDMLAYISRTNEIYRDELMNGLVAVGVPSTEELVKTVIAALGAE